MSIKFKQSRFNHFVKCGNGERLAFNSSVCGLAEMDAETYQKMVALCNGGSPEALGISDRLLEGLQRGNYIVEDDVDEMDIIRTHHYGSRFSQRSFTVTVVPTYNCNFGCDYCYEPREMHSSREKGLMSEETRKSLVEVCRKAVPEKGFFTVSWYGGEPLLAGKIIRSLSEQLFAICEEKECRCLGTIVTNGYLLGRDQVEFLKENKVFRAQVTIDGPRDIHDKRRPLKSGKPTYDVITSNIDAITDIEDFFVSVRVNIDRRNAPRVGELFEDWKGRGWHERKNLEFYFGHVEDYTRSFGGRMECMVSEEFSDFIVDAYNQAMDHGFKIALFPYPRNVNCAAIGNSNAVFEPNGDVQACWACVGHSEHKIGRLTSEGLERNKSFYKWAGWNAFREECVECDILPLCMGGCPYKSIYGHELYEKGFSSCIWWKYNLEPMLKVARKALQRGLLSVKRITEENSELKNIV